MRSLAILAFVAVAGCFPRVEAPVAVARDEACFPAGVDRVALDALKAAGFRIPDDAQRQTFATDIAKCVASTDPTVRDGIAYEAITHMARERELTPETMKAIAADLYPRLEAKDVAGVEAPFAALVLSEMARADRVEAYLSDAELSLMLEKARVYVAGVRDYRGFTDGEGWRHGVAHGADWLMQLALNPRIGREGLLAIRDAAGSQIAPAGHAYVHGESERLMRPVLFAARRGLISEAEWTEWLKAVTGPGELGSWDKAFASEAGLVRLHNVKAFVLSLWTNVTAGEDASDDALRPGLMAVLATLP